MVLNNINNKITSKKDIFQKKKQLEGFIEKLNKAKSDY